MNDISLSDFTPYTIVASLEMSDEPKMLGFVSCLAAVMAFIPGMLHAEAAATDVAALDYAVYVPKVSISANSEVALSVCLKNAQPIATWQADIELPDGFVVAKDSYDDLMIVVSGARTTTSRHSIATNTLGNGMLRILYNSASNNTIMDTDGEVATLTLYVDADVEPGEYPIIFKNIVMSEKDQTGHKLEQVVCMLTVKGVSPIGEEGYALYVEPFTAVKSNSLQVYLDAPKDIASVQFDAEFPTNFTPATIKIIGSRLSDEDFAEFATTSKSGVTQKFETEDAELVCLNSGSDAAFTWTIAKKDAVSDGIYQLSLSNISVVDVDGETHKVAPYKASIFVGDLSSISEVSVLYGDYTADGVKAFNTSFASNTVATFFDFTNATGFDAEAVLSPGNKNALFLASADAVPANESNVIVNGICENLVLTDGFAFDAAQTFTVKSGEYGRTLSADEYATIVLPFAPDAETLKGYTFYELTGVEENALTFDEVTSPVAGKPYIVTSDGTATKLTAESEVTIEAAATEVDGWTMTGIYESVVFTDAAELANLYCISGNQFKQATSKLTMNPFRAYFVGDGSAKSITLHGNDGMTRIISLNSPFSILNSPLYDLQGRQVEHAAQGGIYIQNGKKVLVK